jgi:hypothetical protein
LIYFDILWCFDDVLRLFLVPTWSTENVPMVYHLSTKYGGTHLVWPCLPKKNRCNVVMIIMNHDHLSSVFINYDHLWSVLICFLNHSLAFWILWDYFWGMFSRDNHIWRQMPMTEEINLYSNV